MKVGLQWSAEDHHIYYKRIDRVYDKAYPTSHGVAFGSRWWRWRLKWSMLTFVHMSNTTTTAPNLQMTIGYVIWSGVDMWLHPTGYEIITAALYRWVGQFLCFDATIQDVVSSGGSGIHKHGRIQAIVQLFYSKIIVQIPRHIYKNCDIFIVAFIITYGSMQICIYKRR